MNCPTCKHGQMKPGTTTVTMDRQGTTVVFRQVPAEVCDNCGEFLVAESITKTLLERADRAEHDGTQVQVVQFAA